MLAWVKKISNQNNYYADTRKFLNSKNYLLLACILAFITLTGCAATHFGMLNPKGVTSQAERKLFFNTLALMLIVVLPVIVMSFTFIYHYRASHPTRDYKPHWDHSLFLETLWWGIPCVIIFVLAILTWKKTHELDPYARITSSAQPALLIQTIALPWKWLFIYPRQEIATVNMLVLPVGQEVEFSITADNVPMSAFFIPQLGSQIYAMTGMRTRLHLLANQTGQYDGLNALYNGAGFSDMHFVVHVIPAEELDSWFAKIKKSPEHLTEAAYFELLKPSIGQAPQTYSAVKKDLFEEVMTLYMNSLGPVHPRQEVPK